MKNEKKKIADLIEYHKQEAREPFLTLSTLKNVKTSHTDILKIERMLDKHRLMMKKKHLEWIEILESIQKERND
jgi:hypothetical protein